MRITSNEPDTKYYPNPNSNRSTTTKQHAVISITYSKYGQMFCVSREIHTIQCYRTVLLLAQLLSPSLCPLQSPAIKGLSWQRFCWSTCGHVLHSPGNGRQHRFIIHECSSPSLTTNDHQRRSDGAPANGGMTGRADAAVSSSPA